MNKIIKIESYNIENKNDYKERLRTLKVPQEFYILDGQRFDHKNKNIYFMVIEIENKILWFNSTKTEFVGYCIVEDILDFDEEHRESYSAIYKIPFEVLQEHNVIISDCVISEKYRNMGYGRELMSHVLDLYKDNKISLYAENNSPSFWAKMGFIAVGKGSRIYVLNAMGESYA